MPEIPVNFNKGNGTDDYQKLDSWHQNNLIIFYDYILRKTLLKIENH